MGAKRPSVLAIGMDAAEASLVSELVAERKLPCLASLLEKGRFGRVVSPARIGSGAVWPTFMTGKSPLEHGIHSYWSWNPEKLRVEPVNIERLRPFWAERDLEAFSLGVLDVPFAPLAGLRRGIEISEWGPHDVVRGRMRVSPSHFYTFVEQSRGANPVTRPVDSRGDLAGRQEIGELVAAGLESARRRGALAERLLTEIELDLFLVVFSEVHRASHTLWHTIDGAGRAERSREKNPGLVDVYREVDRQIGRLIAAADPHATVLVFSLHGMRAPGGVITILDPLLQAAGLAVVRSFGESPVRQKIERAVKALKRRVPLAVKRLGYRLISRDLTVKLAGPGMVQPYDWSRTIAFSLPSDQHGWIRVNLAGREAQGIVPRERYQETCREIELLLRGLVTENGLTVVREVVYTGESPKGPPERLPDLIVAWSDAAMVPALRIRTPSVTAELAGPRFSGQHAPDGFYILHPGSAANDLPADAISAEDLHRIIVGLLLQKRRPSVESKT